MARKDDLDDVLRQRAGRAILWNALMRWESAALIALTLIGSAFLGLAALAGLLSWLWAPIAFAVGLVAWTAVFSSSLTDEQDNARVVANVLRQRYSPKQLRSVKLRSQMGKALQYRNMLDQIVFKTPEGVLRSRLGRTIEPVDNWIEAIHQLATRLDNYELNTVIRQDMRSVPTAIQDLKKRLTQQDNPAMQSTLRNTIADKERQWEQLSTLQNMMEKAGYQLQSTLAMLGTIYAQLQAIDLKGAEKGRDEQLRTEITEQVQQLHDLSEAMDEVYHSRSVGAER
jgi:hypothetical protein